MMQSGVKDRILETLDQYDRPMALESLSSWTNTSVDQLKGFMGELVAEGTVQKIGKNHYRYVGTPFPQEGENFSGKVTGASFRGGIILRDNNGTSWRVEPV